MSRVGGASLDAPTTRAGSVQRQQNIASWYGVLFFCCGPGATVGVGGDVCIFFFFWIYMSALFNAANDSFSGVLGSRVGVFFFLNFSSSSYWQCVFAVANGILALRVNVPLEDSVNRSFCRFQGFHFLP